MAGLIFRAWLGVSQNWGYRIGVPIIRIIVFVGLYWGPLILGNYHLGSRAEGMGVLWKVARNQPPEGSRSYRFPESCLSIQRGMAFRA